MALGENLDLLSTSNKLAYNTTYYCDSGMCGIKPYVGNRSGYSVGGGPFELCMEVQSTYKATTYGSRLLYHGAIMEIQSYTPVISSVESEPISSPEFAKSRSLSAFKSLITIKGRNLDKLEDIITDLPEGISISELSEGTEERTAVVTYTDEALFKDLTLKLGGYEVRLHDPIVEAVDLQAIVYNNKEILRTGMDFHICNIEDFSNLQSIKIAGRNIVYNEVTFSSDSVSSFEIDADGNIMVKTDNTPNEVVIDLIYQNQVIGSLHIHHESEEDVLDTILHEEELNN